MELSTKIYLIINTGSHLIIVLTRNLRKTLTFFRNKNCEVTMYELPSNSSSVRRNFHCLLRVVLISSLIIRLETVPFFVTIFSLYILSRSRIYIFLGQFWKSSDDRQSQRKICSPTYNANEDVRAIYSFKCASACNKEVPPEIYKTR